MKYTYIFFCIYFSPDLNSLYYGRYARIVYYDGNVADNYNMELDSCGDTTSPGLDYGNGAYCNYPNGHNDYYSDVKWNSCK